MGISKENSAYITSGRYSRDIKNQYQLILSFLKDTISKSKKNAVVLDLDETIFSSICDEIIDVDGKKSTVGEFLDRTYDPNNIYHSLIPGAKRFYKQLHELFDGNVFIVTGRTQDMHTETVKNMEKHGFNYKGLFMKDNHNQDTARFKTDARREISKKYNVVASIGDQVSDLGDYTKHNFLLVNPFYKI